ncbi:hypothetical protein [Dyadobacter bucti]|jgi:hypothetical protein|uniref:hypothetical protein n=1 Tax=Dyadobacter bucti TaxID=2572203 RepID=UPI001107E9A1|nr:hypothetical protein [Dyadobacter bucti]
MTETSFKSKWANWKFVAFIIILIAIFIKFYVIKERDENAPVTVEIDLNEVAFRSQKEVAAILGTGKLVNYYKDAKAGCEKCPEVTYRDGKVKIIFIENIADRITLNKLSGYAFENRVILGILNLKENIEPTFEDARMKQWENYGKYTQISAFSSKGQIDYILVKSKAE